ncbi:MAG: hypothetical protein HDR72_03380 [Ruminococcaceae bacterium]|nr:hypothetical protein [Oscillospiraceae bacterium]
MSKDKRTAIMLNISIGLMAVYCAVFLGGYFTQYETMMTFLHPFPEEIPKIYSPLIIADVILFSVASVVLNILLRFCPTRALRVGSVIFALCAFLADRILKGVVPKAIESKWSVISARHSDMAGYHSDTVHNLDRLTLPLFAVSLVITVCVCVNKHRTFKSKGKL